VTRIEFQGSSEIGYGFANPAHTEMNNTAVEVGRCVRGINVHGCRQIRHGFGEFSLAAVEIAAIEVGPGEFQAQVNGLIIVLRQVNGQLT